MGSIMGILKKEHKNIILIGLFILLPLVPIGFYFAYFHENPISKSSEIWGQFGDYMGGVINPIFGFISVILLLYTIRQQQEALSLQRDELQATREELARSAKAQEASEKALNEQANIFKQQQFEQTFFSMFNQLAKIATDLLHNNIYNNITIILYNYCYNGQIEIDRINYEFNSINTNRKNASRLLSIIQENIDTKYIEFHQFSLLLYQVLKLINSSYNDEKSRKKYSNILRASIDIRILQILALAVCRLDNETYRPYMNFLEESSFFEHMPLKLVGDKFSFYKPLLICTVIFSENAFGESIYIKELKDLLNQQQS